MVIVITSANEIKQVLIEGIKPVMTYAGKYMNLMNDLSNELDKGHEYVKSNINELENIASTIAKESMRFDTERKIMDHEFSEAKNYIMYMDQDSKDIFNKIEGKYRNVIDNNREKFLKNLYDSILNLEQYLKEDELKRITPLEKRVEIDTEYKKRVDSITQMMNENKNHLEQLNKTAGISYGIPGEAMYTENKDRNNDIMYR